MRTHSLRVICSVLASLLASPTPSALAVTTSTEVEDLRRELETTQKQLKALTIKMQEMQERMQAMEAARVKEEPTAPPPVEAPSQPSMVQIPLGQRQLLLDFGASGDFVAAFSAGDRKPGTFPGRENRMFPQEVELAVSGRVDPYARADIFLDFAEGGGFTRTNGGFEVDRELEVGIDEAYLTLLELPLGLQARLGQMRPKFGRLNTVHPHALPQVDRPDVLVNFLGEEGEVEVGGELSALLPTPFYSELNVGVYNGDNDPSFGDGRLTNPLVTTHLKNFFELSDASGFQIGLSGQTGPNQEQQRTYLAALDLTYKWTPPDKPFTALTLQGMGMYSHHETETDAPNRYGAYAFGDYRFSRRWGAGTRVDWSEFPVASGREWAVAPYVNFWLSDFLRFRLEYKHTGRNFADSLDEVFLQTVFTLGYHAPHGY